MLFGFVKVFQRDLPDELPLEIAAVIQDGFGGTLGVLVESGCGQLAGRFLLAFVEPFLNGTFGQGNDLLEIGQSLGPDNEVGRFVEFLLPGSFATSDAGNGEKGSKSD